MRLRDYHRVDSQLAVTIFGLSLFGLLMLYSASSELSRMKTGDSSNSTYYLLSQLVAFGVGLVGWLVLQQIDYRRYKPYKYWWLGLTLTLLASISVLSKGAINGAHRWVAIGGQSFQPSEFAKLTFILFLAAWLSEKNADLASWKKGFIPFMLVIGALSALMLQQKDLGTLAVMVVVGLAMYAVAGAKALHLGAAIAAMVGTGMLVIFRTSWRLQRITAFLNPDSLPQTAGYHINQAKIAIGLGGLWGKGFLQGAEKKGFLPEAHTDSIFAVVVEELGFIRASALVLVYLFIAVRGLRIARYAPDTFGSLIATGITAWFCAQAFINIAAMVSLIPLTGVPLPFVSYGRTALLAMLMATGIILNVSRYVEER